MNPRVLDASVLLASEDADDDNHEDALWLLSSEQPLATLDLAFYEVTNVAVRAWRDRGAARRLGERVEALADDGGVVRADTLLLSSAAAIAEDEGISAYDAAYVAAARRVDSQLVSCDVRDLVSRGLAVRPGDLRAQQADDADEPD